MRIALLLTMAVAAAAQTVQLRNSSRPLSNEFQVGDRFEVVISGGSNQPVSVRTTRQGRTDWGPVIGHTDAAGRWTATGEFEKRDFGGWSEVWTVGGRLAQPPIRFSVNAPCLPSGNRHVFMSGPNILLHCDTGDGTMQAFATPSLSDAFRTPDGRTISGRPSEETAEQYQTEIVQDIILGNLKGASLQSSRVGLGDETADRIRELIGANALNEDETRNVLAILRAAFDRPETIQPGARNPDRTLALLERLGEFSERYSLKQEIAELMQALRLGGARSGSGR